MTHTASIVAVSLLDLAAVAALAAVCIVPFRLGRRSASASIARISDDRRARQRRAA
jgi:hypothetical protein